MKPIADLCWDDTSESHLWQAHQVTLDEVEEAIFGVPGEEPTYRIVPDGNFYLVFGKTGSGRLSTIVGEVAQNGRFRPFGARNMDDREKRSY